MSWIDDLVRPAIRDMQAYRSARSLATKGRVFLDANESPLEPEWALASENTLLGPASLNRYPEPQPPELVRAMASYYGVPGDFVLVSRGSDEGIELLIRTFCEAGTSRILTTPPTYGVYATAAAIQGVEVTEIGLQPSTFALDDDSIAHVLAAESGAATPLVFVCSPNNPTGNLLSAEKILALTRRLHGKAIVVLDEAYIEFAAQESLAAKVCELENLVVLRTFSKAFALAGIRCGAVIAQPSILRYLHKVRAPYPIPVSSIPYAMAALESRNLEEMRRRVRTIRTERAWLVEAFSRLPEVEAIYPSDANFFLLRLKSPRELVAGLARAGILIRDRSDECRSCVRISVGTRAQNESLLSAVQEFYRTFSRGGT